MKSFAVTLLAALSAIGAATAPATAQPGTAQPNTRRPAPPAAPAPTTPAPATPAPATPAPATPAPMTPAPATPAPAPTTPTPAAPAPGGPAAASPTTSAAPEVLTLERAIEIAMNQQPSLRQSRAQLEAAQGRVDLSRSARRPVISVDASAGTGSTNRVGSGPDFFSHDESTGLGAQATWRIYDFGQTAASIRAAELSAEASAAGVNTTTLDIRTDVETAYLEAIARRRLIQVAEATVTSEAAHLDQARRFVAAQAKDPIEVAQAQARDANARSALAQAQSNEAISLANLRSAIGWVDPANAPVVAASWPAPADAEPPPLDALVATARKSRPEIVQLDKQVAAAEADVDAANAQRRPVLSANASTRWSPGTGNWEPEPSWNAGISLSWTLFDGGRAAADARIARANAQSALAQRDALLVSLTSQLDLARSQIVANRANVRASTEAVAAARAQLKLADARYAQGLGSQIELADAQTSVTTAEGNLIQAEFQLATAWAQLHRATAQ